MGFVTTDEPDDDCEEDAAFETCDEDAPVELAAHPASEKDKNSASRRSIHRRFDFKKGHPPLQGLIVDRKGQTLSFFPYHNTFGP